MSKFGKSLNKFRESLPDDESILKDYEKVHEAFLVNLSNNKNTKREIRCLVIGEAPQSYEKYFYNTEKNKDTPFLRRKVLFPDPKGEPLEKADILKFLASKGIMIVDLYPLPLDSFYYKHPNFYDRKELESYWGGIMKELSGMVSQKCKIAVRYNKLADRDDFIRFKKMLENKFNIKPVDPVKLGGGNKKTEGGRTNHMDINETEFRKILNNPENNL